MTLIYIVDMHYNMFAIERDNFYILLRRAVYMLRIESMAYNIVYSLIEPHKSSQIHYRLREIIAENVFQVVFFVFNLN